MATPEEETETARKGRLQELQTQLMKHADGCLICAASEGASELCPEGGELYGRMLAWAIPLPKGGN
jgi:hypothetical protein